MRNDLKRREKFTETKRYKLKNKGAMLYTMHKVKESQSQKDLQAY